MVKDENTEIKNLLLRFLKFRAPNGNNILHIMATCEGFLQTYKKEVDSLIEDLDFKAGE